MRLSFDTIEEVREFVKGLKTSRTKGDADEGTQAGAATGQQAPAPIMPQTNGAFPGPGTMQTAGFAAPGPGAGPAGGGFPAAGAQLGPAPEVVALVNRIVTRMDAAVAKGETNVDQMLVWFRGQCGAEAANATLDQIKGIFLPRLTVPALDGIAKLTGA